MSVEVSSQGRVCVIQLQRPQARNAVDPEHALALYRAFVAFEASPDQDAAVLCGTAGAFCAGFDLKALAGNQAANWLDSLHFGRDGEPPLGPMGPTRLQLRKPVIAAIEGPAVAGGMELALWADLRVMAQESYMGVYCRRFGVPLIDGGTVRLPQIVGLGRAQELIISGRRIEAQECLDIGLANRVVDNGFAADCAVHWAQELVRNPLLCLGADMHSARHASGDSQVALRAEFDAARATLVEAVAGAERFARGEGRHGS